MCKQKGRGKEKQQSPEKERFFRSSKCFCVCRCCDWLLLVMAAAVVVKFVIEKESSRLCFEKIFLGSTNLYRCVFLVATNDDDRLSRFRGSHDLTS